MTRPLSSKAISLSKPAVLATTASNSRMVTSLRGSDRLGDVGALRELAQARRRRRAQLLEAGARQISLTVEAMGELLLGQLAERVSLLLELLVAAAKRSSRR